MVELTAKGPSRRADAIFGIRTGHPLKLASTAHTTAGDASISTSVFATVEASVLMRGRGLVRLTGSTFAAGVCDISLPWALKFKEAAIIRNVAIETLVSR